jgi:hypothetical protein
METPNPFKANPFRKAGEEPKLVPIPEAPNTHEGPPRRGAKDLGSALNSVLSGLIGTPSRVRRPLEHVPSAAAAEDEN